MFISVYSFGIHIHGDILQNVEEVEEWESYVLRVIFLLVMSTHTPFIFFIGKESLLAIIALLYRRHIKRQKKRRRAERRARRKAKKEAKEKMLSDKTGELSKNLISDKGYTVVPTSGIQANFERAMSLGSDSSDSEGSDVDEYSYQSDSEILIMNSVHQNMANAFGYSKKRVEGPAKEDEDSPEEEEEERTGAEDILPNWMYYTVTLGLYIFVVGVS